MAVTKAQQIQFINTIGPLAAAEAKKRGYGNAQIWTCIAQACCESRYGTATIMKAANAFFGIKATTSWVKAAKYGGKVYSSKTKECYDGKTLTRITACFRAYNNMADSVADYFDLMESSLYRESLKAPTVEAAITIIKNGGYATAVDYIQTICNFYKTNQAEIEKFSVSGVVKEDPKVEVKPSTSKYEVTAKSGLNVRTAPNMSGKIITALRYGTVIDISKTENGWGYIENLKGWCSLAYTKGGK